MRYGPDPVSMRSVEAADAPPASGVMAMTEEGSATDAIAASAAALRSSAITENRSATPPVLHGSIRPAVARHRTHRRGYHADDAVSCVSPGRTGWSTLAEVRGTRGAADATCAS